MRRLRLQLDLRAREGAETQKKGKVREGCKERDGPVTVTGKESVLGGSTLAVCRQGKVGAVRVRGGGSLAEGLCRER